MNKSFFIRTFLALPVLIAVINNISFASDESSSPAKSTVATNAIHKGSVISSFDEDGYIYIKYRDSNSVSWVAVLQTSVKQKDIIEFPDSQALLDYQSRTLKEPFAKIIFTTEIKISESEKSASTPLEEVKTDQVVTATQVEAIADKSVADVAEEPKSENQPASKAEVKKSSPQRKMVISSMSTTGYSYIEYEENGDFSWVAVPETPVKPGDIIEFPDSQLMTNFASKSLGKTFSRLYMASELRIVPNP